VSHLRLCRVTMQVEYATELPEEPPLVGQLVPLAVAAAAASSSTEGSGKGCGGSVEDDTSCGNGDGTGGGGNPLALPTSNPGPGPGHDGPAVGGPCSRGRGVRGGQLVPMPGPPSGWPCQQGRKQGGVDALRFDRVCAAYRPGLPPVLTDVSFKLPVGGRADGRACWACVLAGRGSFCG
jgi:hypothetical protein